MLAVSSRERMATWTYVTATCECGSTKDIRIDQFNRKNGLWLCRSCAYKGRTNKNKGTGVKHDAALTYTRNSYYKAKQRCKTNHKGAYANVEFRFSSFAEWLEELGLRPEGMTVDRIDPMGHYEPGNVRWASIEQQARNRNPRYTWTPKPPKIAGPDTLG
jgi:hypothetical protein